MEGEQMLGTTRAIGNPRPTSVEASGDGGKLGALVAIALVGLFVSLVVALVTQDWSPSIQFTGLE
jgi:hypothetical protein